MNEFGYETPTLARVATRELDRERYAASVSDDLCIPRNNVRYQQHEDRVRGCLVHTIYMDLFTAKEERSFAHPSDWWEALKDRWFPLWARTLWPVKQKVTTVVARALFPELEVLHHKHRIHYTAYLDARVV